MSKQTVMFASLAGIVLLPFLLTTQVWGQGHCEGHCDAPGFDIAGFITGPNGGATAQVDVYDYSDPAIQQFAKCLETTLRGQRYNQTSCGYPYQSRVVWAPTSAASNGTYSMKDANGKGVQAGRYLIVVIDTGF